jgi:diaminopimelate epimerase
MQFTKMHGIGNDYIFVNCLEQPVPESPETLVREISDRHFGIGADGLILISPSTIADAGMKIWNADGTPAEMCGNGARCVAKYFHDYIEAKGQIQIETPSGVVSTTIGKTVGSSTDVSVNMGKPVWDSAEIPTTLQGNPLLDMLIPVGSEIYEGNIISFGNPHSVFIVDQLSDDLIQEVGPAIENHYYFPERINVEFVQIINPSSIKMRVWERGSGETLACGSGACASFAVCNLKGLVSREVTIDLPGGQLQVHYDSLNHVILTGSATEVFTGQWDMEKSGLQPLHSSHPASALNQDIGKNAA